jgi:hypothetical protein
MIRLNQGAVNASLTPTLEVQRVEGTRATLQQVDSAKLKAMMMRVCGFRAEKDTT